MFEFFLQVGETESPSDRTGEYLGSVFLKTREGGQIIDRSILQNMQQKYLMKNSMKTTNTKDKERISISKRRWSIAAFCFSVPLLLDYLISWSQEEHRFIEHKVELNHILLGPKA